MKDNFIQLEKDDVLRLEIRTDQGESTGEYLEFDLEDIELPLKYQTLLEKHKKNYNNLNNQIKIIEKREDVKGKKLLSKNQEDEIRALNDFFKEEIEIYNIFLGENGVQKLLNGRKMGWSRLREIDTLIEKQILPLLEKKMVNIEEKIKGKYGSSSNEEIEMLEVNE